MGRRILVAALALLLLSPALTYTYLRAGIGVTQQGGIVNGETGRRLDAYLTSLTASDFSGVVMVVKDGQVVLSKGYGAANRRKRLPFTEATVFDIGSITKQFTAAAVLKLETQGRLRVSDPIGNYLANVPPDKSAVTVHHLLTHTAGFANNFGQDDYAPLGRDDFIKAALASPLKFAPGEGFNYSNIGYGLLGAIIEIVAGQSYERYLHDNLFAAAGMSETGNVIPQWDRDRLAVGYYPYGFVWGTPLDGAWDADGPYWNLRAASALLSTTADLYKWHVALEGDAVLSKEAREKFFTPHIGAHHYGYGWVFTKTRRGTTVVWHDGSNKIFNANFRRYVDEGVVLVIFTNNASRQAEGEVGKIEELIFGGG